MTSNRLPAWLLVALAAGPAVGLVVFYVWPLATLLAEALSGEAFRTTMRRSSTWSVLWFTLWQAVVSTTLTIVIGLGPAHLVARYEFRGRRFLVGLLTAVFVLPTVVMGAAFLALLPPSLDRTAHKQPQADQAGKNEEGKQNPDQISHVVFLRC